MEKGTEVRTSVTLLGRLCQSPPDPAAWEEFEATYRPHIGSWCRRYGLQDADSQDVIQIVLLKLFEKFPTFKYNRTLTFCGWLRTITKNVCKDLRDEVGRPGRGNGANQMFERLLTTTACDDLAARLDQEFERALLEEAMARVRARVAERTWEAFALLTFDEWSGGAVAERLGMSIAAVYVAKSRVRAMLADEIALWRGPEQD